MLPHGNLRLPQNPTKIREIANCSSAFRHDFNCSALEHHPCAFVDLDFVH
jgi:hypothetical protein